MDNDEYIVFWLAQQATSLGVAVVLILFAILCLIKR